MKCISIKQPWAWLIFHGKPVENRSWPSKHRGPLLIHASKSFDWHGFDWARLHASSLLAGLPKYSEMVRGALIGQVNMIDCVTSHPSPFFFGPWGHVYADPVMFKTPIPYKGRLGIFEVPQGALTQDGKCPVCGEFLVYPRGDSPYCEECLWPDEVLPKEAP